MVYKVVIMVCNHVVHQMQETQHHYKVFMRFLRDALQEKGLKEYLCEVELLNGVPHMPGRGRKGVLQV